MRRDRIQALEHQLHAARDQVVDRRRAAAIRNVHDVRAGHELEQLAADMTGRAVARGRVRQLAGIVLCVGDQLRDRLERRIGRGRQQHVSARDQRDRLEVALDVVGQLRHHVARDGERADRPHADGVTVGIGFRREIEPDGQRPARAIVDDDLLAELLGKLRAEDARDRVGRAARRLRHDQPDRLVGKFGRGRPRESARKQQHKAPTRRIEIPPVLRQPSKSRARSGNRVGSRPSLGAISSHTMEEIMSFRITGLPAENFQHLFSLDDAELGRARRGAPKRARRGPLPHQPDRRDAGRGSDPGRTTSTMRSTARTACALRSMCARARRPMTRSTRCRSSCASARSRHARSTNTA